MEVGDADDFSPELVIEHVKKLVNASAEEKEAMNYENFAAALKEEVAMFKPQPEPEPAAEPAAAPAPAASADFPVAETVAAVRSDGGAYNWLVGSLD